MFSSNTPRDPPPAIRICTLRAWPSNEIDAVAVWLSPSLSRAQSSPTVSESAQLST